MAKKSGLMQVCVTCRRIDPTDTAADARPIEGQLLHDRLVEAVSKDDVLRDTLAVEPVQCMNSCQQACTVSLRSAGKYGYVIAELDKSDERVDDLLSFSRLYVASDTGAPVWRERPEHVRKNTLVRLHPSPEFPDMKD
ncbi:DUF1636 family protein [Cohaesibacter intestini]|uniref:DUF1636 family protein n=1 Tax=Cohaesibacter intestini TaxID=2211145 RepID=UPI000DEA49CD|nr:DUF1636 domain-containing protein [Cohaesibacter intestini]